MKYLVFFKDICLFPLRCVLRLIFSLSQRKKDIWIFSSWGGRTFSDNSKYLFLYANDHMREIEAFWITKQLEIYRELRDLSLPVLYLYSWKGFTTCLRAGAQFTTHGIYDIAPTLTKGAINFSLFHASFPLKKMEHDAFNNSFIGMFVQVIRKPFVFERADFSICSSEATRSVIGSALDLDQKKVLLLGYPRADYTKEQNHLPTDVNRINNICNFKKYKNFIYFAPTFRNDPSFNFFEFEFDKNFLLNFLEETDSVIIFRFHPFDYHKVPAFSKLKHHRIIFESHGLDDPYPLLHKASLLITDFSSIFADYLLLDRPIIFANFDHAGYVKNERSLYWNYDEVTPGPKVNDWPSLLLEMRKILVDRQELYSNERQKMKELIFGSMENLASKRVCKNVKEIIFNTKKLS